MRAMKVTHQGGTWWVDTNTGNGHAVCWREGMTYFALRFRTEDGPRFQPLTLSCRGGYSVDLEAMREAANILHAHLTADGRKLKPPPAMID